MAEIWIPRGKHEIFSLKLSQPDELQESHWGHVGKHQMWSPGGRPWPRGRP